MNSRPVTVEEACLYLGVNIDALNKLIETQEITKLETGSIDKTSIVSYKRANTKKRIQRITKIEDMILNSWKKELKPVSINEIARRMKLSTSLVSEYISLLIKQKKIEKFDNTLYPNGLKSEIDNAIKKHFASM